MGIVKISDQMHDNVRIASSALNRSINAQAEHWMLLGMLSELHPGLAHSEISQMLVHDQLAREHGGVLSIRELADAGRAPAGQDKAKGKDAPAAPRKTRKEYA
ncbi:ParD-like family protein [Herbaspirillum sp. SJZ099]|uniref:ParD-like family protein n=1 Tax=Herbaspirillum sp. SJZ099 TaxID=2572916 RepID=UPI0011A1F0A1|nr:ParD-like family protein [Herbaspirillum sp. SJZ099]TWC66525.1 ParD-like antitoxin of type II ParDE toxin-antitoxin system [Herbaspirillum sp. SJZ099]